MTKTLFRRIHLGALTFTIACSGAAALAQDEAPATKPAQPTASQDQEDRLVYVQLQTTMGNILLALNETRAPVTVKNFLGYVKDGTYSGTIFHRVINGFMIQGGGFTKDMVQKPVKAPITNEWRNGLKNKTGTIAMARTQNPNSATDQFFINVKDNTSLDQPISGGAGYAVFGKVVAGMDVVDKIKAVPTGRKTNARGAPMNDVPTTPIVIEKAVIIPEEKAKKMMSPTTPPKKTSTSVDNGPEG